MWGGLLRFAGLLGSLAEAKTDEEAGPVLQAATAPLGSYREFRQGGWVGFLSGYAGMAFAGERGDGVECGSVFAPLLPVGLELGHKLGRNNSLNLGARRHHSPLPGARSGRGAAEMEQSRSSIQESVEESIQESIEESIREPEPASSVCAPTTAEVVRHGNAFLTFVSPGLRYAPSPRSLHA